MIKKGVMLCLVVFLACISMSGYAEDEFSVSEKLIVQIDFSSWFPKTLKVSPDSKRMAYVAVVGDKWFVVVDGKEEKQYDAIGASDPIFSPDSKRVAYYIRVGDKRFVIVDGKEEKQYDGIGGGSLIFSPDSKRVAYMAQLDDKQFVVVDGKEEKQYDAIIKGSQIVFDSPNNLHYLAIEGDKIYLVETVIKSGSSK